MSRLTFHESYDKVDISEVGEENLSQELGCKYLETNNTICYGVLMILEIQLKF